MRRLLTIAAALAIAVPLGAPAAAQEPEWRQSSE